MGEIVEATKVFVSPAIKLIDCIRSMFGKIYEPIHVKRMAKANAFALQTMQKAIDSNPELAQAYNNGMIQIDNKELNELATRSIERSLYQEMVKQQNLESIVAKTYGLLENEPDVPNEPVEQDWMARFVNSVETISDDDMQLLWAKVLAGEIKKPKTYSLRTLENLKNLSKEEALLFQQYCEYIITSQGRSYFINEDALLEKSGLSVDAILKFSDCGIANDSTFLNITINVSPNTPEVFFNDELIIICRNPASESTSFTIQIYTLTKFGNDLVTIINKKTSNDFLIAFAKYIKSCFKNIQTSVHRITGRTETDISFDQTDLLNEKL